MVGVGQTDLNSASEQVDRARREVENCEVQVRHFSAKETQYYRLILKAEADVQEADRRIGNMVVKLKALTVKRETVADFQDKTRRAVHDLGKVCGVGSVAERQTRHLVLLDPIMKVMEEMMAALGQMTGDELLRTEEIQSLMWDVKDKFSKLEEHSEEALCKKISDDYW